MAAPTFVNAGAGSGNTTAITPALPADLATNDILLLHLETFDPTITIADSAGGTWAAVTNSPKDNGSNLVLTVFWSRYNGTQTAPTTSDSGDHQYGVITAYRGCPTTGNPWDATAASDFATIGDAFIGVTTTVVDCLIVHAAADNGDQATPWISGSANANLTSITERHDAGTTAGNGGELAIVTGIKATAGATGNTSYTYAGAGSDTVMHTIALKPAVAAAAAAAFMQEHFGRGLGRGIWAGR